MTRRRAGVATDLTERAATWAACMWKSLNMDTQTACAMRTPAASDAITALISRINESKSNPQVAENHPHLRHCRKAFQPKMLIFNALLYTQIPPWERWEC